MKHLLFSILIFIPLFANSQTVYYTCTPLGDSIGYRFLTEYSAQMRDSLDDSYAQQYPNAVFQDTGGGYSSSNRFSCASYALHIYQGNDTNDTVEIYGIEKLFTEGMY